MLYSRRPVKPYEMPHGSWIILKANIHFNFKIKTRTFSQVIIFHFRVRNSHLYTWITYAYMQIGLIFTSRTSATGNKPTPSHGHHLSCRMRWHGSGKCVFYVQLSVNVWKQLLCVGLSLCAVSRRIMTDNQWNVKKKGAREREGEGGWVERVGITARGRETPRQRERAQEREMAEWPEGSVH